MKSYRSEIERLTPYLRQFARALVAFDRPDIADELVHDAVAEALRHDQSAAAEDIHGRLMMRLIGANRLRIRNAVGERRTAPGPGSNAESRPASQAVGYGGSGVAEAAHGLEALSLNDREALLLVVLGKVDYPQAAEILGIPVATLITRLVHARDSLGETLWVHPPGRQPNAGLSHRTAPVGHLRLVKS
jgi:RNA polymerase sigma-70 factor (ECF subfamily)